MQRNACNIQKIIHGDIYTKTEMKLTIVGLLLVIYLLGLLAIYLQIDIYLGVIYKLILFLNWI